MGAAAELHNGTLKLRYSSNPFSKRIPTLSVANHSSCSPVVGHGPGSRIHFPDERPC